MVVGSRTSRKVPPPLNQIQRIQAWLGPGFCQHPDSGELEVSADPSVKLEFSQRSQQLGGRHLNSQYMDKEAGIEVVHFLKGTESTDCY